MNPSPSRHRLPAPRALRQAVSLVVALALGAAAAAQPTTTATPSASVRFAPERDYGPFVYAEADGQIQGLSVDLLAAIAPRAGLQVQILAPRDLADILEGVKAGEVDLVSSLRPNPERSRFLGFSAPYVEVPAVLVLRKSETRRQGLDNFRQRRVGVGKAYAVEAIVRQRYAEVQWEAQAKDAVALRALAALLPLLREQRLPEAELQRLSHTVAELDFEPAFDYLSAWKASGASSLSA